MTDIGEVQEICDPQETHDGYQEGVSVTDIANKLVLHKSSVSRRVKVGIRLGYLEKLEAQKGRPARLVPGDPLPDDIANSL